MGSNNPSVDYWALGITLLAILTGSVPDQMVSRADDEYARSLEIYNAVAGLQGRTWWKPHVDRWAEKAHSEGKLVQVQDYFPFMLILNATLQLDPAVRLAAWSDVRKRVMEWNL